MFKKILKSIGFIWHFAWQDRRASKKIVIATTLTVSASLALNVSGPTIVHSIMSTLPTLGETVFLDCAFTLAGSFGLFWSLKNILRLTRTGALFLQSNEIAKNMSTAIADKIFKQKMLATNEVSADAIANVTERAYESVDTIVQKGTINFIQNVLEISAIAAYLSYRYNPMFLLGIATTTTGYVAYTMAYVPRMVQKRNQYLASYRKSRETAFDMLHNNHGLKFFGRIQDSTNDICHALSTRNNEYAQYAKTSLKIQTGQTSIVAIGMTSMICYALLTLKPSEYNQLAKIIGYILQWSELFENLGTTLAQFENAVKGVDDLHNIFEQLPVIKEDVNSKKFIVEKSQKLQIAFHNVSLICKEQNLLSNISFALKQGKMTALIGHSGAGKSTLAKLLLRLEDPSSGDIYVSNHHEKTNLRNFQVESWRQGVAYLTQGKDTVIFKRSLRENLEIVKKSVTPSELMAAISLSGLNRLVNKLPKGLDTILGEGSASNLSGGERKLLALARFLLFKEAPVCILDEPSSDLDPDTASSVLKTIETFTENKTTLLITHDLNYANQIANQIISLETGKVIDVKNNMRTRRRI